MKSWNEIRKASTAFSKRWKNAYDEKSQAQSFLKEFFAVFGVDAVTVAMFDHRVKFADGSRGYADCTGAAGNVSDALGRPATRNADTFGYNARSEVTLHTREGYWPQNFAYDGWNLVEERVAYTNGNSATFRYYWGKDLSGTFQGAGGVGGLLYLTITTSNIEHQTSNSQLFIPCYDSNANITRYLDENGATVAQYTYDAFGNLLDKSGPLCDLFRQLFSTKYFDRETDLCYYGCRYYSPALMRWINRDPIGGQDSEANPYLFINNQATFDTDYLGMNSNTKMEATANQWHPLGTSTHEYHVWNCSEWPTYDGKQGGTYEKYVQHFSRVTFTMFYKVPADYKLYFAYGIPTTLEMDKKQSSYWCLDLKPFSVYWRHNNRKNAKEYKVTFTVTNFDRHPCLREHPNYLQSKFIGKTISYGPKP